MSEMENSGAEPQRTEAEGTTGHSTSIDEIELEGSEPEGEILGQPGKPGIFQAVRRGFERGWQKRPESNKQNRKEKQKDKTRMLFAMAAFTGVLILMFILVFSSPRKSLLLSNHPPGTPDLGKRTTPGEGKPHENVMPLMNVKPASNESGTQGLTTAQDVAQTARQYRANAFSGNSSGQTQEPGRHTLADIHFENQALQEQYAMHGTNPPAPGGSTSIEKPDDLKTPSLVFVRAQKKAGGNPLAQPVVEQSTVMDSLPVGTHLVARLETPVSTALQTPAVAVIEYNYEQDGEIILPAGTQVIGKLRNATRQGYVSIEFNRLQFQDGTTEKIDAIAMGLDYKPLKGRVMGRNRGLRFLVQSLTGVGEVAAYMVGGSPGTTSVFSEDALLREQLASNMATAGQEQFNELATQQHIVVTVPGNTRFYLVLEQGATSEQTQSGMRPDPSRSKAVSGQELEGLEREIATAIAQEAARATAQPDAASQQ